MENERTVIPVSEFCERYKMPKSTVYRKIQKHAETELNGHIIRKGNRSVFLDDFAVRFLCPQVMPVKTFDDQFSEIRADIENEKTAVSDIKDRVSKLADDLSSLAAVFYDNRQLTDEKLEQVLIRIAVTDDKISTAMKQLDSLQENIRKMSERLEKTEEKVRELSDGKNLFGRT